MLSNQVMQNAIDGLKSITKRDMCVIDQEGKVSATTDDKITVNDEALIRAFTESPAESQSLMKRSFFKAYENGITEYIVIVNGDDDESYRVGKIAAFHIQSLLIAYKERYDKDNFIKNLLLDNLLLVDIYNRAKKLKIDNDAKRVVILVETVIDSDINPVEIIRSMFPQKGRDFVVAVDETNVIIVKELRDSDGSDEIEKQALVIHDTICAEIMNKTYVAIGTPVTDLKNVSNSYKEAKMALAVGKIFDPDKLIINYDRLGIGRLIYQLPVSLCKMFVGEALKDVTIEQFDEETLSTVAKFFEYSLNVSETSRQLYIHRNTLVYRLDKIQKMTGLDLRTFDDAITFKITMMVTQYMNYLLRNGY